MFTLADTNGAIRLITSKELFTLLFSKVLRCTSKLKSIDLTGYILRMPVKNTVWNLHVQNPEYSDLVIYLD